MASRRVARATLLPLLLIVLIVGTIGGYCDAAQQQQQQQQQQQRQQRRVQIDEAAGGTSVNLPASGVPEPLVRAALAAIGDYQGRQLGRAEVDRSGREGYVLAAQKLTKPPHVIYKLQLSLDPSPSEASPNRETCSLDVRQHTATSAIEIPDISILCTIPRHSTSTTTSTTTTTTTAPSEQELLSSIEKQILPSQSGSSGSILDSELQTSSEHQDRPFTAVRLDHASAYCPNCPYELNPSLPGLAAFAQQALRSMDESGTSDFKHKLVSVVRVTRAIPPGAVAGLVRYQLLMEIGESTCLRQSLIEPAECPLQGNLPVRLCAVTFEERAAWQQQQQQEAAMMSRRITKNNCTEVLSADNEVIGAAEVLEDERRVELEQQRMKQSEVFYDQIAQEAREVYRGVKPVDAEETSMNTQTAPPDEARLKLFDAFLSDFSPSVERTRSKRSPANKPSGEKYAQWKLATHAVELLDRADADNERKRLLELLSFQRSTVGNNERLLELTVGRTDCRESGDEDNECLDEVLLDNEPQVCKLRLVVADDKRPLDTAKLLNYECKKVDKREKRQTLGGAREHSADDPEVIKFAELGRKRYAERLLLKKGDGGEEKAREYEPVVRRIKGVTVQVVAGRLYKIQAELGPSGCKRGEDLLDSCINLRAEEEGEREECEIRAWSRPWLDKGNPEITVKCAGDVDDNKPEKDKESEREKRREKRAFTGRDYSARQQELYESARPVVRAERLFQVFEKNYQKKYGSEKERNMRFEIFKENLDMIEELQINEQGTGRYGVTYFSDLTKAEFTARYLGLRPDLLEQRGGDSNELPLPLARIPRDVELPEEFDWRKRNAVTPVKNQGACGSCWAFSVTGNVEGQYAIKHGKLLSLSEQELVDCDKLDDGCRGGMPDTAYRAIEQLGGLELEEDYPYDGADDRCQFNSTRVRVKVLSGLNITSTGNETEMAQWLVKNGPMSVGINANAMQFYMGGVSHPYKFLCSPENLDHGVLIVGYGIKTYPIFNKKLPYWTIKNSWGTRWGEQGYYRIYRGDGACGVNKMVTSAVVA